ncbi:farnesyl pyrophosphate synthase 1-like [Harmonia axyridis]|uniref:farnesyl pyrophosphate synthase 1-like n=1 Tax=Harmonia axyridis TaxID=115357 RepID=UPI001E279435|nr:farnesyl pyrophosphate synthase 1-like [Harmonia axyridis]
MLKNSVNILGFAKGLKYTRNHILPSIGYFSTVPQKKFRNPHEMKYLPQKDLNAYMAFLPHFIDDVTSEEILLDYQPVNQRIRRLLEYFCPTGKHLRQHLVIYTYKAIEKHHGTFRPENMEEVHKLCWCLELYNAANSILDDILDDHDMRRNMPSWQKMEGKAAVNDMVLLYLCVNKIMKKYFHNHPNCLQMIELLQSITPLVSMALELEWTNFDDFTIEKCDQISEIQSSFYLCVQPFQLTTLLTNKELQMPELTKGVFYYLGILQAFQNDLLDIYGEDEGGKSSRDIQENRGTYLIAVARQKANYSQMKILKNCYGKQDQKSIDTVRGIYDELDVLGEYYKLEEKYLEKASEEIRNIKDEFCRSLIEQLAYFQSFGVIGVPPH